MEASWARYPNELMTGRFSSAGRPDAMIATAGVLRVVVA
jgi:hypothetical protein